MNYWDLMKAITRMHVTCTRDYTSCPCTTCDAARRDHWHDQQYDLAKADHERMR